MVGREGGLCLPVADGRLLLLVCISIPAEWFIVVEWYTGDRRKSLRNVAYSVERSNGVRDGFLYEQRHEKCLDALEV